MMSDGRGVLPFKSSFARGAGRPLWLSGIGGRGNHGSLTQPIIQEFLMTEEWLLGQGFRSASNEETDTDGSQAGETEFHGESLVPGKGPGWEQSCAPGSTKGRQGRKIGVKIDVNGFGGGIKSKRYPDGQAVSGSI